MAAKPAEAPTNVFGCYDCGLLNGAPVNDALVDFLLVAPVVAATLYAAYRLFVRLSKFIEMKTAGGEEDQE